MSAIDPIILDDPEKVSDLAEQVLLGKVFVIRNGLQKAGVFGDMLDATRRGVAKALDGPAALQIATEGYEHIHQRVTPMQVPELTDAVYAQMAARASNMLDRIVGYMFPTKRGYYFEKEPNVRFHIPFDEAAAHKKQFDAFAKKRGQGKIAPHGPHRDPWLDCPDNVINVWIAVGPVQKGNGLTVFTEAYDRTLSFNEYGEVPKGEGLSEPMTFDLSPGDVVLFHSDHVHGSEINRTNQTRYVVSYRIAFGRPHFPYGHYHSYLNAVMARGMLKGLADVPARLQWSYARSFVRRALNKVSGKKATLLAPHQSPAAPGPKHATGPLKASDIPVGAVRPYNECIVVARLSEAEFVATTRTCPHKGADLADGFVIEDRIVCPWHNLPFDAHTGQSPCQSLKPIMRFRVTVKDDTLTVDVDHPLSIPTAAE